VYIVVIHPAHNPVARLSVHTVCSFASRVYGVPAWRTGCLAGVSHVRDVLIIIPRYGRMRCQAIPDCAVRPGCAAVSVSALHAACRVTPAMHQGRRRRRPVGNVVHSVMPRRRSMALVSVAHLGIHLLASTALEHTDFWQ
jgi:hypothetical protein